MNQHRDMRRAQESDSDAGYASRHPADPTDAVERRVEDRIAAAGETRMQSPVARIYPPRDVDSPTVRCVVCNRPIQMNLAWTVSLEQPVPVAEQLPRHPTMRPMTQPPPAGMDGPLGSVQQTHGPAQPASPPTPRPTGRPMDSYATGAPYHNPNPLPVLSPDFPIIRPSAQDRYLTNSAILDNVNATHPALDIVEEQVDPSARSQLSLSYACCQEHAEIWRQQQAVHYRQPTIPLDEQPTALQATVVRRPEGEIWPPVAVAHARKPRITRRLGDVPDQREAVHAKQERGGPEDPRLSDNRSHDRPHKGKRRQR